MTLDGRSSPDRVKVSTVTHSREELVEQLLRKERVEILEGRKNPHKLLIQLVAAAGLEPATYGL